MTRSNPGLGVGIPLGFPEKSHPQIPTQGSSFPLRLSASAREKDAVGRPLALAWGEGGGGEGNGVASRLLTIGFAGVRLSCRSAGLGQLGIGGRTTEGTGTTEGS